MMRTFVVCCVASASVLCSTAPASACGDKLAVVGGGVSFQRVSQGQYRGNIVMLLSPNSALRAADDELKIRQALEYAGNKVRTVENEVELQSIVAKGKVDIVLVSWSDATAVRDGFAGMARAPYVLPVAYGVDTKELTAAAESGSCYSPAKDKQVVKAVGHVMEQRQKNLPVECSTVTNG